MPSKDLYKLDNPVWHSLNEAHHQFSISYGKLKCYHPDQCLFGGYEKNHDIAMQMVEYANLVDNFFIVGERPFSSEKLSLKKELVCLQMVTQQPIKVDSTHNITKLNGKFEKQLFDLVDIVQPGYFRQKTSLLGEYFGIFENEELVAVTGERMKTNFHTEVSAVVTHPHYIGRGFAKHLVAYTVNNIFNENKTPFLHVAETNFGAITLYEKLGFKARRKISFWNFSRK